MAGPVFLPKIYNGKDKTFFFFSYEGTRLRQRPTSSFVNVLTPQERAGDFSGFATAVSNYLEHYQERNHQGKDNLLLFPARVGEASSRGAIGCRERLGGLLKYYSRAA